MTQQARVAGVVLAAGEGRRMGMPKALVRAEDGHTWLARTLEVLDAGGCSPLTVVVGAAADRVRALAASAAPPEVDVVVADRWRDGMGESLRAALLAPWPPEVAALLVMLVDLPDVGPAVIRRVLEHADAAARPGSLLARATYGGRPGHPVLLGRDHWAPMAQTLSGDEGGRRYLTAHRAVPIECGDLASGRDQDTPSGTEAPQ